MHCASEYEYITNTNGRYSNSSNSQSNSSESESSSSNHNNDHVLDVWCYVIWYDMIWYGMWCDMNQMIYVKVKNTKGWKDSLTMLNWSKSEL